MSALSLEQLTSLAGTDSLELGNPQQSSSPFEDTLAYQLEITDVKHTTSKGDYNQVEVSIGICQGDGLKRAGRKWIMLPVFTENMQASADPEKLAQLKSIYGRRFHQFLRAVFPETFNIYASSNKTGKSWRFFDEDGNELSNAEKREREKQIGIAVLGAAKAIVAGEDLGMVGKRLYFVQTRDKKDANRTYDNFFGREPDNYELAPTGAAEAVPF